MRCVLDVARPTCAINSRLPLVLSFSLTIILSWIAMMFISINIQIWRFIKSAGILRWSWCLEANSRLDNDKNFGIGVSDSESCAISLLLSLLLPSTTTLSPYARLPALGSIHRSSSTSGVTTTNARWEGPRGSSLLHRPPPQRLSASIIEYFGLRLRTGFDRLRTSLN